MTHEEAQDVRDLIFTVETEILAQDPRQILTGQHHIRTTDQRCEIAIKQFHVHGRGPDFIEKFAQPVELVIAQWLLKSSGCS